MYADQLSVRFAEPGHGLFTHIFMAGAMKAIDADPMVFIIRPGQSITISNLWYRLVKSSIKYRDLYGIRESLLGHFYAGIIGRIVQWREREQFFDLLLYFGSDDCGIRK